MCRLPLGVSMFDSTGCEGDCPARRPPNRAIGQPRPPLGSRMKYEEVPGPMSFTPGQLRERTLHRRAIEAAVWGMPAVNYDAMYQALVRDAQGASNQIVYWSRPLD